MKTTILTWEPGGVILRETDHISRIGESTAEGVVLDSCHGLWHFSFTVARHALARGFSRRDQHGYFRPQPSGDPVPSSDHVQVFCLGLSVEEVISMSTINPAGPLCVTPFGLFF